nr:immunoglobulin heavy chain junction region [Macaca mulatta]
CARCQSVFDYW